MGAARLLQYRYRDAFDALLRARDIAVRLGDRTSLAAVAVNLSSLYLQTWDLESAVRAAEEGLSADLPSRRTYYRLPLILQLGKLHQMLEAMDGRPFSFKRPLKRRACRTTSRRKLDRHGICSGKSGCATVKSILPGAMPGKPSGCAYRRRRWICRGRMRDWAP